FAIALGRLHVDDTFATAGLQAVLFGGSALAVAVFGNGKYERSLLGNDDSAFLFFLLLFLAHLRRARLRRNGHADDIVALVEVHAADAVCLAAHGANVVFAEADGLTLMRCQEDNLFTIRE